MFRVEWGQLMQPVVGSDEFRMYEFKVRRCPVSRAHDWTVCPWAHPGERARRRDPRRVPYKAVPCEEFRTRQACRRGESCEYAHGVFEYWLHPSRYRTRACISGAACNRKVCFFAHAPAELRSNTRYPPNDRASTIKGFQILPTNPRRRITRVECQGDETQITQSQCDDEMPHVEWIKDLIGS